VLRTLRPYMRLTQKLSHQGPKKALRQSTEGFFWRDGVFIGGASQLMKT
jgi:hypothetical protein